MGKFTPGPWSISRCKCGDPVCRKWNIDHSGSNGMFDEADASLIAAAPEMYGMIKALIEDITDDDHRQNDWSAQVVIRNAQELLARIEGDA